jgi:TonB family protein
MINDRVMKRKFLWMLCIGVGYWMLAQDVSAKHPLVAKPYRTKSARMAYLSDSTSANQEENVFIDGVPIPEFPGGTKALVDYVVKNTRYPKELLPDSIKGRVIVRFTIDEGGKVCSPEVLRSLHPLMDAEALRIVLAMPRWEPARDLHHGKPMPQKFTLPIMFRLPGE